MIMTLFDQEQRVELQQLSTELLDLKMVNYQTDRIFIGARTGIIQCLHEVQAEWPLIRAGGLEEDPAKAEEEGEEAPDETMEEPEEPVDDPFGAETTEDPFGTESETEEDPFGTESDSGGFEF